MKGKWEECPYEGISMGQLYKIEGFGHWEIISRMEDINPIFYNPMNGNEIQVSMITSKASWMSLYRWVQDPPDPEIHGYIRSQNKTYMATGTAYLSIPDLGPDILPNEFKDWTELEFQEKK